MATQKSLAYHFPLELDNNFDLVATSPKGKMIESLASRHGERLQAMTPEMAKIHMQEAMEAGDWLAMAAISMAMANI